jgi:ABC-type bacteriocin/lantibiotic exporter with double-glycine peptidase domain
MLQKLQQAGRRHFHQQSPWEVCLCALILAKEPQCPINRIIESLPHGDAEIDEADILNTMAHLGYVCHHADADLHNIDLRLLPAIFIPEKGIPFLVLGRDEHDKLCFYDPISQLISHVPPCLTKGGVAWFFQPYEEHLQPTSLFMRQGSGHQWFRSLLGRFKGTFVQIMVAGFILNIIALTTPLFIMLVYDRVIATGSLSTLPMLAIGAAIAIAFEWWLRKIRSRGLSWLAGRLDNIVGNRIFAHLIGLSPTLIERASVAAQIARIKTFESVRDFFAGSVFLSLLEAPFVIIAIAAISLIAGNLVFVPLAMVFGYLALFFIIRSRVKIAMRLAAKASSARQQFTIETFDKLEAVRAHGLGSRWQEKFRHLSGREMMAHAQLNWLGIIAENIAHALTIIAALATVGFGVQMVWDGSISTGALVATMILVWRVLTPFYSLCTMIPRLEQLRSSIEQVNQLMDIPSEAEEARSFARLPQLRGAIEFHHVTFRYHEGADPVFQDVSFQAHAGDIIAITGSNGSGKASVLKLIQGLHVADTGMVRLDGFDIRQLDALEIRRQIAYLPKIPHFFYGTIEENLRFSNLTATQAEVQHALKMADAWEEVQKLPHAIDTLIGADKSAVQLTASLKTRLALARLYLHQGNVVLIDEIPNTLLSGIVGENLKEYLLTMRGKKTICMCAYRDDFLSLADVTLWLRGLDAALVKQRNAAPVFLDELMV